MPRCSSRIQFQQGNLKLHRAAQKRQISVIWRE
jgi:hypothetical protein